MDAVITDVTKTYLDLRAQVEGEKRLLAGLILYNINTRLTADYAKVDYENGRMFLWTSAWYYTPVQWYLWRWQQSFLQNAGGSLDNVEGPAMANTATTAVSA